MAHPSEKPISRKLQLRSGHKLILVNPPNGYKEKMIQDLPKDVTIAATAGLVDVVQIFVKNRKELETNLPRIKSKLKASGILWVTYPKGTSTMNVDINRDVIREYAPRIGMEAVAIFSVDNDWSALRLKMI